MKRLLIGLLASLVLLGACSAPAQAPSTATVDSASQADDRITELEKELKAKEAAIAELQQQMQEQQKKIESIMSPPPPSPSVPSAPASFVLGDLTITPASVKIGELVTISLWVSNIGGTQGSYTVVFKVKAAPDDSGIFKWTERKDVEVILAPGETKTATFTTAKNTLGIYNVDVNGKTGQFTVTPSPPTPEELAAKQVIKDLAYIKAWAMPYSDDADPQYEGLSVSIGYYDSKSEVITFSGVPIKVTIEFQMYGKTLYLKQTAMSSSGTFFGEVLKIPFGELPTAGDPNVMLIVVVSTPTQGDFNYRGVTRFFWW